MTTKKVEALEEKLEERCAAIEAKIERMLDEKLGSVVGSLEEMVRKMFEANQSVPQIGGSSTKLKEKDVEYEEPDDASVYQQDLPPKAARGDGWERSNGGWVEHGRRGHARGPEGYEERRRDFGTGYDHDRRREFPPRHHWGNTGGRESWGGDTRIRKLKMPVFEGDDAHGWVYRVERYFAVNGVSEEEKLMAAGLCLEGKALAWFQWMEARYPFRSWEEFKDGLMDRFQTTGEGDLHEQFYALTQEETVREYREKFELLSGRLRGISMASLEGNFMKGLKPDIRASLRILRPQGLRDMMELAQRLEDKKMAKNTCKNDTPGGALRTISTTRIPTTQAVTFQEAPKHKKDEPRPGATPRRLTETELLDRRAKGLCFRCDEKFTPGHHCRSRALQVLLVHDAEAEEDETTTEEREEHHHFFPP